MMGIDCFRHVSRVRLAYGKPAREKGRGLTDHHHHHHHGLGRLVMAIKHKTRPMWGVQFHPESICTEYGKLILQNFRDLSLRHCTPVVGQAPPLFTPTYLVPPSRYCDLSAPVN
jgi:hypothetical protein